MPRKDEVNIKKEQKVCHTPIDLDTGDKSLDQRVTPLFIQLDSQDESEKKIDQN